MLRAALAKEVALWRAQFGTYISFTRNDFNKCFVAAFYRVQEQLLAELLVNPVPSPPPPPEEPRNVVVPPHQVDGVELSITDLMIIPNAAGKAPPLKDKELSRWLDAREAMGFAKMKDLEATGMQSPSHACTHTHNIHAFNFNLITFNRSSSRK